ncbi:MAG: NACHT domain-containing protein, partial [Deltaproteobacteria bacterium]|nr:NACHT domain-containing protein [Deltaproteobacteria bacterium]
MAALESIVCGVIANGLTALLAFMGRKTGELLTGKELRKKLKLDETALKPILEKAVTKVADTVDLKGPGKMEEVSLFLHSPEVETMVRQIFSFRLSMKNEKKDNSLELIRKEFLTHFALFMGMEEEALAASADFFMDALLKGADEALSLAIDMGILSAHEAKSALRHQVIVDELDSIKKNLDFLCAKTCPSVKAILEFEEKYREQVEVRHGQISPPSFQGISKRPIDELYVCPSFFKPPTGQENKGKTLKYKDFISTSYRTVILGNPGGGKSTFTQKLSHDLAVRYSKRLFGGRLVTPVLVILRDYGASKAKKECSILQFIESKSNSSYQLTPPKGAFEYLFLNGRAVVIFDGLDELLDTSYRREISGDIEAFCNLYPSVPVLVTSREVGYEQAPLDVKRFETYRLATFDNEQVKEYVQKWFSLVPDLGKEEQRQKAESFMDESESVSDLRDNPLLLALMCNIYRGETYIPRNRAEVYEKCALMLFDRWDKHRGIRKQLPFEAHIRPVLNYLAHWIYCDKKLQNGVTDKMLVGKTSEYLCKELFDDKYEARQAAGEFIEFCRGRAWVFTDTGTTGDGESLFQFAHRTFLEYFTAEFLAKKYASPGKLKRILFPRIAKREWDIVAQLAFQVINNNIDGAGNELLRFIMKEVKKNEDGEKWNYLLFAARTLGFLVPSPEVIRELSTEILESCLRAGLKNLSNPKENDRVLAPLRALLVSSGENWLRIAKTVEMVLVKKINGKNDGEAMIALEIGMVMENVPEGSYKENARLDDFQDSFGKILTKKCYPSIEALSRKYLSSFIVCFHREF